MDSHAETIEKQKERIRNLQTERETASSEALTAREQVRRAARHLAPGHTHTQTDRKSVV